jgi:hypothetical protein
MMTLKILGEAKVDIKIMMAEEDSQIIFLIGEGMFQIIFLRGEGFSILTLT